MYNILKLFLVLSSASYCILSCLLGSNSIKFNSIQLESNSTKSIIYLALCKLCDDPLCLSNFYFGQSVNSLMSRNNGHRGNFKINNHDKSALSMHVYDKHPENFDKKLLNFDFGVVKSVSPMQLNRVEDSYIFKTEADTKGLNRYKVSS